MASDWFIQEGLFVHLDIHSPVNILFFESSFVFSSGPGPSQFPVLFHVEIDGSDSAMGAVLQQNGHPLAFIGKALSPRNQTLSMYEKEYLAILLAVDSWRHYLM